MPLPTPPPSRNIENLGPAKTDRDRAPDDTHYLKASEWNTAVDYILKMWTALDTLLLAGSTVQLQDAYANAAIGTSFDPVRIVLSNILKRIVVTDASPSLGSLLLGVSRSDGSDEYGFWPQGLRLSNQAAALHSGPNVSVRMQSGQANGSTPAFIFDTANGFAGANKLAVFRNSGVDMYSFGALGQFTVADPLGLPGSVLYGFVPSGTGGQVRLVSTLAGGGCLLPQAVATGRIGLASDPWRAVHARQHATSRANFAAAAGLVTVNALDGEIAEIQLDGDVDVDISNPEIGCTLTLVFIQDATGGHRVNLIAAALRLNRPFGVSQAPNALDSLTLRFTGVEWVEIGRSQEAAPELSIGDAMLTGGNLILKAHRDAHTQSIAGTLAAAATIQIDPAGAANGDRVELIFEEATGLVTTAANTLTIKIFGGATLALFNQNKTLRGRVLLYHNGTEWKASYSGVSYA